MTSIPPLILPFTANRLFHQKPRLVKKAQGMYYTSHDDRQILDTTSGLWCVNAGHCRDEITTAIKKTADQLDYAPAFQMGFEPAFNFAERLAASFAMDHIFFTNSGSEAVETALKIALYYHQLRHHDTESVIIAREQAYHGVCLGGLTVGGMHNNRAPFAQGLKLNVAHLKSIQNIKGNEYHAGFAPQGIELADELKHLIEHHGKKIAAVILEPVSGSAGVLIPPHGYLEKIASLCHSHDIPLILDEVITGFGRLGAISASQRLGLSPDIICSAKGLTNGAVPMGMVAMRKKFMDEMSKAAPHEYAIEFPHGFTYSNHPLAVAAADATLTLFEQEDLFARARTLENIFADAIHSLKGLPHIISIRTIGMMAGIQFEPEDIPTKRTFEIYRRCFEQGLLVRSTGETLALSPPLIISHEEIAKMTDILTSVIKEAV